MKILGLAAYAKKPHDNAAALVVDGGIAYAELEERVSRKKHDGNFPVKVIERALERENLSKRDIGWVGVPAYSLKIGKWVAETGCGGELLKGLASLFLASPGYVLSFGVKWVGNWLSYGGKVGQNAKDYLEIAEKRMVVMDHHLAHAASSFYLRETDNKCLVVVLDGWGEDRTGVPWSGAVYEGRKGKLKLLERLPALASIGAAYSVVTRALGFKVGDGEGKTMGLAAYGNAEKCKDKVGGLFPVFEEGKWKAADKFIWLSFFTEDKQVFFRTPAGREYGRVLKDYKREDVAAAAQEILEERLLVYFKYLVKKYRVRRFAGSGGVFLNVKMTKRIQEEIKPEELFIPMAPNDPGLALGAALVVAAKKGEKIRIDFPQSAALGKEWDETEMLSALKDFGDKLVFGKEKDVASKVVERLLAHKVVGIFQGRAEFGPRALGNRSVLCDPRDRKARDFINKNMKNREWFMPFAPSVLKNESKGYFEGDFSSPYMDKVVAVKTGARDKLVAAIHVDGTARPQQVEKKNNLLYWQILKGFYDKTGVAGVLNTSFNNHGLPIVDTPKDAVEHLLWGCIDELFMGSFWVRRKGQRATR